MCIYYLLRKFEFKNNRTYASKKAIKLFLIISSRFEMHCTLLNNNTKVIQKTTL